MEDTIISCDDGDGVVLGGECVGESFCKVNHCVGILLGYIWNE